MAPRAVSASRPRRVIRDMRTRKLRLLGYAVNTKPTRQSREVCSALPRCFSSLEPQTKANKMVPKWRPTMRRHLKKAPAFSELLAARGATKRIAVEKASCLGKSGAKQRPRPTTPEFTCLCSGLTESERGRRLQCLRLLRPPEHGPQVFPAHREHGQRPKEDIAGVQLERGQWILDVLVERPSGDDRAQGPAGTDHGRDDGQVLRDHVRHDAVAGALGHVHEDREDDKTHQGHRPATCRVVDATEKEEEDSLPEERDEVDPQATLHLPASICPI